LLLAVCHCSDVSSQIKTELQALQKIHAETVADRRPGSEEIKRLQHELQLRQEAIDTLHTELADARRVTASEQPDAGPDEDALSQLTTPESTPDPATWVPISCMSSELIRLECCFSAVTPTRPTIATRSQPLNVIRTVSGSLISELSKQPTPAPSSPEADHDVFENMGADDFETPSLYPPSSTPHAAGPSPSLAREAELEEEVEKFKRLAEEARKVNQDREKAAQEKVGADVLILMNSLIHDSADCRAGK
jgi:hypothetical protein